MNDPLGLINSLGPAGRPLNGPSTRPGSPPPGASFAQALREQIDQVNQMQSQAADAATGLMTGQRSDVENVLAATATADAAFRMLQAVRNKVMEAYDEIKQIRV